MTVASHASGRYAPGEGDLVLSRRTWRLDGRPACAVLYCHGAGTSGVLAFHTDSPGQRALLADISEHWPTVAADLGGPFNWGNNASRSRVEDARVYAQGETVGASDGPVVLVGASMGAAVAVNYAAAHPSNVACMVLILPVVDLQDIRVNDRGGYRSSIDSAWGVTYPAALPAGANPTGHAASVAGIPTQVWYAPDDAVCTAATVEAFATATDAELHSLGNLGHTAAAIQAIDREAVTAFIAANT